jgi:hypothetical protein
VKGYTEAEDIIEVSAITLDGSLPELGFTTVDFIKIDAEGAEPAILRGMEQIIVSSKKIGIILELNPSALRAGSNRPNDLIDRLIQLNFNLTILLEDGSRSNDYAAFDDQTVNLLCLQ